MVSGCQSRFLSSSWTDARSYETLLNSTARDGKPRRAYEAIGFQSLGWPTEPGLMSSPSPARRCIGRCVWPTARISFAPSRTSSSRGLSG